MVAHAVCMLVWTAGLQARHPRPVNTSRPPAPTQRARGRWRPQALRQGGCPPSLPTVQRQVSERLCGWAVAQHAEACGCSGTASAGMFLSLFAIAVRARWAWISGVNAVAPFFYPARCSAYCGLGVNPGARAAVKGERAAGVVTRAPSHRSVDNTDGRIGAATGTYRWGKEAGRPVSCESRVDGGAT